MSEKDAKEIADRCQCDRDATHHVANYCQNKATWEVVRENGVVMRVCGDCTSGSDKDARRL